MRYSNELTPPNKNGQGHSPSIGFQAMPHFFEDTELDMYADNSTLAATGKSIETLDDKLNSYMEPHCDFV